MLNFEKFRHSVDELITSRLVFASKSPDKKTGSAESPSLAKKIRTHINRLMRTEEKGSLKLNINRLEDDIKGIESQLQQLKDDLTNRQERLKKINKINLVEITSRSLGYISKVLGSVSERLNSEEDAEITPEEEGTENSLDEDIKNLNKKWGDLLLITKIQNQKKETAQAADKSK